IERPEDLLGDLEYNADLFESATIERLVNHWQTLLEAIVAHPEQRLSQLPLLTQAERQQLLVDWNATQTPYPRQQSIPHLFEAQVERTPEAVALLYEGQPLTYHELN